MPYRRKKLTFAISSPDEFLSVNTVSNKLFKPSLSIPFLLPRFPLPLFPALIFGAENSTPAISTPALWCHDFHSRVFHSREFSVPRSSCAQAFCRDVFLLGCYRRVQLVILWIFRCDHCKYLFVSEQNCASISG